MSLRMMLIALTWVVVTAALVGATYRLPNTKPKEARDLWFLLAATLYMAVIIYGLFATLKERRGSSKPWTHTFSTTAVEYQGPKDLYVIDRHIIYAEESPGVFFEVVGSDLMTVIALKRSAAPSKYAGQPIVISNGSWASEKKAEQPTAPAPTKENEL